MNLFSQWVQERVNGPSCDIEMWTLRRLPNSKCYSVLMTCYYNVLLFMVYPVPLPASLEKLSTKEEGIEGFLFVVATLHYLGTFGEEL